MSIRTVGPVLDSPFHSAIRTTQPEATDFSHSIAFFCYLLAFYSSIAPSFFPEHQHLQGKTAQHSSSLSTSTIFSKHYQNASQGLSKSSFTPFRSTLCLSLHTSPERAARVDATSRIGHTRPLLTASPFYLPSTSSSVYSCQIPTRSLWTCTSLTCLHVPLLADGLGSVRARVSGTQTPSPSPMPFP